MTVAQERYIERNACLEIRRKWPGAECIKMREIGFPDRLVLLPGGGHCWIEFKTPTGKLSERQKAVHQRLKILRQPIYVCTNTREALACANRHLPSPRKSNRSEQKAT